jgi:hypothetical protein
MVVDFYSTTGSRIDLPYIYIYIYIYIETLLDSQDRISYSAPGSAQ